MQYGNFHKHIFVPQHPPLWRAVLQLDRLKDLTTRDAEEQAKKAKRVEDRKVITEQIEARQRAKLIRLEAREQVTEIFRTRQEYGTTRIAPLVGLVGLL